MAKSKKEKEDDISVEITRRLKEKLKKNFPKVFIGTQKHVFIGTTIGTFDSKLKMILQSAKQDIVLYLKPEFDDSDIFKPEFIARFPLSFPDEKFIIPLVIFEVKYQFVDSHQVRQYSEEARLIRHRFPFCSYNLVLIEAINLQKKRVEKVYMAGKHYNAVINFDRRNYTTIIKKLYQIIEKHIQYLREEEFFRLSKFL